MKIEISPRLLFEATNLVLKKRGPKWAALHPEAVALCRAAILDPDFLTAEQKATPD